MSREGLVINHHRPETFNVPRFRKTPHSLSTFVTREPFKRTECRAMENFSQSSFLGKKKIPPCGFSIRCTSRETSTSLENFFLFSPRCYTLQQPLLSWYIHLFFLLSFFVQLPFKTSRRGILSFPGKF